MKHPGRQLLPVLLFLLHAGGMCYAGKLENILNGVNPFASQPTKELEWLVEQLTPLEDHASPEQQLSIDLLKMRLYAIQGDMEDALELLRHFDSPSIPPEYRVRAYTIAIPIYHMLGDYISGFKYLNKTQLLLPWIKDPSLKLIALSNAPELYIDSGDLDKALELSLEDVRAEEAIGSPIDLCGSYDNLAGAYLRREEFSKAAESYRKMIRYCKTASAPLFEGMARAGLGTCLQKQKQHQAALKELETALKLVRDSGYRYGIAYILVQLANVHFSLGHIDQAQSHLDEAMPLLASTGISPQHTDAYALQSELAMYRGDANSALEWYKKKSAAEAQVMDNRKTVRIAQLQVEFEVKNKEEHIEQLMQDNRLLALQKKNANQRSLITILGLIIVALIIILLWLKAKRERSYFKHMSQVDPLTDLYNHAYCYSLAEERFHECRRLKKPFTVVVADIDWFKYVNDTYGHAAGDKVLQHIAAVLKNCLGKHGIVGRTGGEEFTCFLPGMDISQARQLVENCRRQIHPVVDYGKSIEVTLSYGLAQAQGDYNTLDTLVRDADETLYKAKRNGRNQVLAHVPRSETTEA
ncbi:tetratricopeptide repeat-containing diguanylate cyclase [Thiolapillus sp.]